MGTLCQETRSLPEFGPMGQNFTTISNISSVLSKLPSGSVTCGEVDAIMTTYSESKYGVLLVCLGTCVLGYLWAKIWAPQCVICPLPYGAKGSFKWAMAPGHHTRVGGILALNTIPGTRGKF